MAQERPLTPSSGGIRKKLWLAALLVLHLILACAYSAVTPPSPTDPHNPDENAHVVYVQRLASGRLPVFGREQDSYEAHQPPLYYALCVPVDLAARGRGATFETRALRVMSALLGLLLVLAAYMTVRALFPEDSWFALATAAFVALLPGNVALSASVSNDALTNLVFAVALWRLALLICSEGANVTRQAVWLGIILGVGIWTKTSTLLLFPVVLFAYYVLARQKLISPQAAGRGAGMAAGLGLVLGTPWLLRNQMLYGDPVAQHLFVSAFANTAQADAVARYVFHGSIVAYLGGVARWTFASFWGVFDSMRLFWGQDPHRHPPSPAGPLPFLYNLLAALCALSVIGLARLFRPKPRRFSPAQTTALSAFALLIFLTGLAHFRFILTFFQAQGRYWYPALIPLAFFFVLGARGLFSRPAWFRAFLAILVLGLLALNAYTLFGLLLPRFQGQ